MRGSAAGLVTEAEQVFEGEDGEYIGSVLAGLGDLDGDGLDDVLIGSALATYVYMGYRDTDGDGLPYGEDCDDDDSDVGGPVSLYVDADGDAYGSSEEAMACPGEGYASTSDDCDDTRADVHPGAVEVCDADDTDEDCDGLADDADESVDPAGYVTGFADADGDGYGADAVSACDPESAVVEVDGDCDDADGASYPGAEEILDDGVDQDCDGADATDPGDGDGGDEPDSGGCACRAAPAGLGGVWGLMPAAWLVRRRRS